MEETIPFKNLHSREYQGHKKKVSANSIFFLNESAFIKTTHLHLISFLFSQVHSVAWNCTGTKLASGSVDQTARVWHIEPHGHVSSFFFLIIFLNFTFINFFFWLI